MRGQTFGQLDPAHEFDLETELHDHPADAAYSQLGEPWNGRDYLVRVRVVSKARGLAVYSQDHTVAVEELGKDGVVAMMLEHLALATLRDYRHAKAIQRSVDGPAGGEA